MTQVKEKVKEMFPITDKAAPVVEGVKEKGASVWASIKNSTPVKWVSKAWNVSMSFLNKKKLTIAVTSASVTLAGALTTGACTAVAVGAGAATLVMLAIRLIQARKDKGILWREMLSDVGVAAVTAMALPFLLWGAAYAGLYATVYGAVLPYALIVA